MFFSPSQNYQQFKLSNKHSLLLKCLQYVIKNLYCSITLFSHITKGRFHTKDLTTLKLAYF
jgi:hypothetical protein